MVASRRGRPSTALMRAALTAAERGHHVFPLHPDAKTPAYKNDWLRHATTDPDRIHQIWRTRPYNIGIACAPSGLLVIDLDPAHGQQAPAPWTGLSHGRDVLAAIATAAGQPYPGPTYTVSSPSAINGLLGHFNNVIHEAIVPARISSLQHYQQDRNDDHVTDFARRQERAAAYVQR